MKLVREHIILEKFTQESDPIKDMSIGSLPLSGKFFKTKNKKVYITRRKRTYRILNSKTAKSYFGYFGEKWIGYVIDSKIEDKKITMIFNGANDIDVIEFLNKIKNGDCSQPFKMIISISDWLDNFELIR